MCRQAKDSGPGAEAGRRKNQRGCTGLLPGDKSWISETRCVSNTIFNFLPKMARFHFSCSNKGPDTNPLSKTRSRLYREV